MSPGAWARRNALALVALPVVAGIVFVNADENGLRDLWRNHRRSAPEVPAGGAADWHGVRYEAVSITAIAADDPDLIDPVPPGTRALRAVIEGQGPEDARDATLRCAIRLVDDAGRVYTASPADLSGYFSDGTGSCWIPSGAGGSPFEAGGVFLLPGDAVVHAVRVGDVGANDVVDLLVDDG